jgi:hypothetical protein
MPDPLSLLVFAVVGVAGLSLLLARLIPDEYDRPELKTAPVRRQP